jgi:peptide/nickel transport system substrate-binding protein
MDPQLRDNIWTRAVLDNIYESLIWRADDGTLTPLLASDLPEQVDDTTWRLKLREGVMFSNGEPFNAESAAASINRIINPDYGSELLSFIDTIASAEAVDDTTLEIKTKERDVILPARLASIKMVPLEASQEESFGTEPVGTGPYVWVSGGGAGPIVLRKNADYWDGDDATIEEVQIRAIENVSTRISALNAGEVDLVTVLPPDAATTVPKAVSVVGIENPNVVLNAKAKVTADPRVRRALNLAVDKEAIANSLFAGYADVSKCQIISPQAFGYDPNLEPYAYDPDEARRLLEEAGATGAKITFVTSDVFPKGREMAQVIAAMWTDVGLDVEVQTPDFNQYIEALYGEGDARPEAVYLQTSTDLLDADRGVSRLLVSDAQASEYEGENIDTLAAEARQETDPAKRAEMYRTILKTACDDPPVVYLLNPEDVYGTSTRLVFQPRFDSALLFANMSVTE